MNESYHSPHPTTAGRWAKRLAIGLLGAVLLALGIARVTQQRQSVRYAESLRKTGQPVTLAELNRWYPTVLPAENAATLLAEAFPLMVDAPKAAQIPGHNKVEWPPAGSTLPPDVRSALEQHLQVNSEALTIVREALQRPRCRFPIDLTLGVNTLLPELAKLKHLANLFRLDAALQSDSGNASNAVESVLGGFGIARFVVEEPILISQLVRIACEAIALDNMQRVVSAGPLPDEALQRLMKAAAEVEERGPRCMGRALVGERCFGLSVFEDPRQAAGLTGGGGPASPVQNILLTAMNLTGLRHRDMAFYLQSLDDMIAATTLPFPECLRRSDEVATRIDKTLLQRRLLIMSRMLLPALGKSTAKQANVTAQARSARAGLAVERYRLANGGRLPATLDELVPAFLPAVPQDPNDGQPLRYERLAKGFRIVAQATTDAAESYRTKRDPDRITGFAVAR